MTASSRLHCSQMLRDLQLGSTALSLQRTVSYHLEILPDMILGSLVAPQKNIDNSLYFEIVQPLNGCLLVSSNKNWIYNVFWA